MANLLQRIEFVIAGSLPRFLEDGHNACTLAQSCIQKLVDLWVNDNQISGTNTSASTTQPCHAELSLGCYGRDSLCNLCIGQVLSIEQQTFWHYSAI